MNEGEVECNWTLCKVYLATKKSEIDHSGYIIWMAWQAC